jgi:hypothetical protein
MNETVIGRCFAELISQAFKEWAVPARCPDDICAIYKWVGRSPPGSKGLAFYNILFKIGFKPRSQINRPPPY